MTETGEALKSTLAPPSRILGIRSGTGDGKSTVEHKTLSGGDTLQGHYRDGVGAALTDTPATTAPNSPRMQVLI